ncbi:MAG: phosphoribosyltransferase family protein [Patescibacteria group bacterium]|nr:phosphoribosyltransferase family protein [Patescibacteria group bacterium]
MPKTTYENGKELLTYSWPEYFELLKKLAHILQHSHEQINQLIGITTGGIIPALALGNMLGLRPAFLAAQSYEPTMQGSATETRRNLVFDRELASTQPGLGNHVGIVDDLSDSGVTFERARRFLTSQFGYAIDTQKFIAIWQKSTSTMPVDWFAEKIGNTATQELPYIVQPHELEFGPHVLNEKITLQPAQPFFGAIRRNWQAYFNDIKKLAQLAHEKEINQVIALTMGGLIPGLGVARILGQKPAILAVSGMPQHHCPDHISFARDLIKTTPGLGSRILIIDDRSWTKSMLERTVRWLRCRYDYCISEIFTAVLYHGPQGYPVDIAIHEIESLSNGDMPKLIQPMASEFHRL